MLVTGFEQFSIGQTFTSEAVGIEAPEIEAFARDFDQQPQHLSAAAAKESIFGTLVASGWHTAALTMRLLLQSAFKGTAGRGMGVKVTELVWLAPIHPGDRLHLVTEVLEMRPSRSKPDRGLVTLRSTTMNQHGAAVQSLVSTVMVLRSDA